MKKERRISGVFTRRALFLMAAQTGIVGALGTRLWRLQAVEGQRYATLAEENRISVRMLAPPRGRLLDRSGETVAGNRLNWRALLVAEQAGDINAVLDNFSRIVPLADHERARIVRDIQRRRRFVPAVVRDFLTWEEMIRLEVNAPDLPGVLIDAGTTRVYPFGEDLAHVVGYVAPPSEADIGEDPLFELPGIRIGRAGMERAHDPALRGRAGALQLEVNAIGRVIRELDRREGQPGQDVRLTIDAGLQQTVRRILGEESASAVVLDAQNGEVLAMGTNPSFDPSLFNEGVSQAQWREWTRNKRAPLINKAATGLYAPGSTFKMVVALAALEARVVTPGDRMPCPGYYDLGNARFHCWNRYGHGAVDMRSAIKLSCDCYFYEVARRTGQDRVAAMAHRLGLGVPLEIELPGLRSGLVPTRGWRLAQGKPWSQGDTVVHGIGQGFTQVTPLQLATMAARLASGRAVQPHLTREIGGSPARGRDPADWPELNIPGRDLRLVREAMWAVVNERGGTAARARLEDRTIAMAGKTGTSQVRRVTRAERERGFRAEALPWEFRPHALFVAFAPFEAPRYAVSVVVEHGLGGAAVAAPIARDIMTATLAREPGRAPATPPPATPTARRDGDAQG